jgi:ABC-type antimicrobial peptide transport system permease subunit
MANAYFRGRDPIGRTVTLDDETFTIVAVVSDMQEHDVRGRPVRRLYMANNPADDQPLAFEVLVRVAGDPSHFVAPIRDAVLGVDRTLPLEIEPVGNRVRHSLTEDLLLTKVTTFFGVLTLVLAALGLYGVTAYSTSRRTSEFGLRIALGAHPSSVARMVVREGATLAVAGVAVGIPVGLAAVRFIRGRVFGVSVIDLPSIGVAIFVLVVTAIIASYVPARRAARVGPLEALRAE